MKALQLKQLAASVLVWSAAFAPQQVLAFDGCKVLLCLAGSWQLIQECEVDVRKALRCMARGRCWPTCNDAPNVSLSWTSTATCPRQYGLYELDACGRQLMTGCTKSGVIDVAQDGNPAWTRVWFNLGAEDNGAVVEYSEPARAALGTAINPQFDLDYLAWAATQSTEPPVLSCDQNGNQ